MSETPVVVGSTEQLIAPAVQQSGMSAPKLNAIQLIEQELMGFIKQREQAVANVHAVEGAIQAAQHLLGKLRAEVAKAVTEVEQVADNVIEFVKKEL